MELETPRHPTTLDRIERGLRDVLRARDRITFVPTFAVALGSAKRIRAGLVLACGRAVELPEPVQIELAVATELMHTSTLIHADIETDAVSRRGHPAVHVVDGTSVAINAGDGLHALAWSLLLSLHAPPKRVLDVARRLATTIDRMVAAQARMLSWLRDRPRLSVADYLELVRDRSGALLGFAAAAPLELVGHAGADRLYAFGEELGIALQLLDDVRCGAVCIRASDHAAIDLAHRHVELACEELEQSQLGATLEIQLFAETMLARLVANTRNRRNTAGTHEPVLHG